MSVRRSLDFGLANSSLRSLGSPAVTRAGQVFGTPAYMSPEQIAGQEVDARVDIYAAGILLFEMLVGHAPFRGDASEVLRQHIMEDVPVGVLPSSEFSNEDAAITLRATAKTRAARFANAKRHARWSSIVCRSCKKSNPGRRAKPSLMENAPPEIATGRIDAPEERVHRSVVVSRPVWRYDHCGGHFARCGGAGGLRNLRLGDAWSSERAARARNRVRTPASTSSRRRRIGAAAASCRSALLPATTDAPPPDRGAGRAECRRERAVTHGDRRRARHANACSRSVGGGAAGAPAPAAEGRASQGARKERNLARASVQREAPRRPARPSPLGS